jgi:RimJ/RimL family protein N-acetyltransferase
MLEGRLVRLRAVEKADAERAYRWINDREVTRYLMARCPISQTEEDRWVEGAAGAANGL